MSHNNQDNASRQNNSAPTVAGQAAAIVPVETRTETAKGNIAMLPQLGTDESAAALVGSFENVAGQLAPRSKATYGNDTRHFAGWLDKEGLTLETLGRDDFIRYRAHLAERYAKATAARMLTVARRLLTEAVQRGTLEHNPANGVRGYKGAGENETPHVALSGSQARTLLDAIDRSTPLGLRDYAMLMLLIRSGIRRAEAAALTLGDFGVEQGHHVLTIRHGKGDKRRKAKVPVDVMRAVSDYLEATGRKATGSAAPLFVAFRKGKGQVKSAAPGAAAVVIEGASLTEKAIEKIVKGYAARVGITGLTPHGLRASFITLALENGAKLQQVQYAAGHADPRTTERYQKRKFNLDDNAVDYVRF